MRMENERQGAKLKLNAGGTLSAASLIFLEATK
jgi:hypothetical protein